MDIQNAHNERLHSLYYVYHRYVQMTQYAERTLRSARNYDEHGKAQSGINAIDEFTYRHATVRLSITVDHVILS